MSASDVTRDQPETAAAAIATWVGLLRAHAKLTRELNASLLSQHGLTVNDYEVLLHLSRAPQRSLRRVDLSQRLLLTASGITRLLDGLERCGLVTRRSCELDGRVVYAELTAGGLERLRQASQTHLADVQAVFEARYAGGELELLGELLGRLSDDRPADPGSCRPPAAEGPITESRGGADADT